MAGRAGLTDEQVEQEIKRLRSSEAVQLVWYEQQLKYKRRKYMYLLRSYEKKGKVLMEAGITKEKLKAMYDTECELIEIMEDHENERE